MVVGTLKVSWPALLSATLAFSGAPLPAQSGALPGPVPVPLLETRRQALLAQLGSGIAVLPSAPVLDEESNGDYPQGSYRQDNDFFRLTGLEEPGSWLVLVADSTGPGKVILYLPPRDPATEQWNGARLGPGPEAAALSGIQDVRPATLADEQIPEMVAQYRRLWLKLIPKVTSDPAVERLMQSGADTVMDLRPVLGRARLVKDADEVARLRRAITLTTDAQVEAMRSTAPGAWEYEIQAGIEAVFRRGGADRLGFPSIIGSGPNSTTLHYVANHRQTQSGDLVVTDVGAEYGYYTADVTRTWPVSGKFTPRQRALYDLVLGSQQIAIDSVRPGITLLQLHRIAQGYLRHHSGDLCAPKTCDQYFIHGLSHWLGMDVHDVGPHDAPLAPGMVLTVEPGVYLAAEGLGIRIEDDVLVTASGHELLSAGAPRAAADIERVMAEGARLRKGKR
jgi:Xaa-Pro aminopeptidase